MAKATKNQLFESSCDGKTVRELEQDVFLGGSLIDTITGLLPAAEDSMYLAAQIYTELLKEGYGDSKKWIQGKDQVGHWFFAVYEDFCRIAIGIDWSAGCIEYYDPQCSSLLALERRDKVATVSAASSATLHYETDFVPR